MMTVARLRQQLLKPVVFMLCLLPLVMLVLDALADNLGANPIEAVTRATGEWTLRLLFATLAVTPVRELFGWGWLMRLRRMLGLFAFFLCVLASYDLPLV